MKTSNRKNIIIGAVTLLALAVGSFFYIGSAPSDANADGERTHAVVYKSPTCGCCGNYVTFLKREGFDVETVNMQDLSEIKETYGVGGDMESCHTTVIGDVAVEGHVPVEAIRTLLADTSGIKAIALPNMPSGAPGMPGSKRGPFLIHKIGTDGQTSVFAKL